MYVYFIERINRQISTLLTYICLNQISVDQITFRDVYVLQYEETVKTPR